MKSVSISFNCDQCGEEYTMTTPVEEYENPNVDVAYQVPNNSAIVFECECSATHEIMFQMKQRFDHEVFP